MRSYYSTAKASRGAYASRKSAHSEQKPNLQKQTIVFMAIDEDNMGMHLPYSLSNDLIRSLVKENGGAWCHNFKIWKIPKESYTVVRTEIPRILPDIQIEDLPVFLDRALKPMTEKLSIQSINKTMCYDPLDRKMQPQINPLYPKLYEYQREALKLAIKNYGRLMIADQMGVGKSIEALACALAYVREWPLLIICPSALKHVWREQIKKWLSGEIKKQQVQIIQKFGQPIEKNVAKIVIISYQIATKSIDSLTSFNVVIADEAHYLKNDAAKRTENILPFLTTRKRIFLASGTPALAKPREVFNLVQVIRPDIFASLKEFGDRYCCMQRNRWTFKMEYEGCRNLAELHFILKNRVMIRRLKADVLGELPSKLRQTIVVETNKNHIKEIKELMNSNEIPLDVLRNSEKLAHEGESSEGMSPLPRCYLLSGLAKTDAVKLYLSALFENDVKVLIFAHHKTVMDELSLHLEKIKCEFIRIDGSTSNDNRRKLVKNFQDMHNIRAALLSITAAGVGITLTAASTVVFAELHWTPAFLLQAEDRAHRIGQKSCVNIHYLLGENTLDHLLMRQLQKKLETTGDILDGSKQSLEAESLEKGELGRMSAPSFQKGFNPQKSILEFMRKPRSHSRSQSGSEQSDIDDDDIPDDELEKMITAKEEELKEKLRNKNLGIPSKQSIQQ